MSILQRSSRDTRSRQSAQQLVQCLDSLPIASSTGCTTFAAPQVCITLLRCWVLSALAEFCICLCCFVFGASMMQIPVQSQLTFATSTAPCDLSGQLDNVAVASASCSAHPHQPGMQGRHHDGHSLQQLGSLVMSSRSLSRLRQHVLCRHPMDCSHRLCCGLRLLQYPQKGLSCPRSMMGRPQPRLFRDQAIPMLHHIHKGARRASGRRSNYRAGSWQPGTSFR